MNNKIKYLLLLMTIMSLNLLNAQGFQLTPQKNLTISGGYVNSWLSGEDVDAYNSIVGLDDLKSRHDFFVDLSYLITTEKNLLRFEPGLRYIHRGWTLWDGEDSIYSDTGQYLGTMDTYGREKLYYLDLYLNYKPKIYTSVFPYIGIGSSYLLDAKFHAKIVGNDDYSTNTSKYYHNLNFIAIAGFEVIFIESISLGIEYNRFLNVIFDLPENVSMFNENKPKAYINSFLVSLGVKL